MSRAVASTATALLLAAAGAAAAQTRPDTVPPESLLFRLPGITVTATRSPMRVLDVPLAVTVVGRARFQDGNGMRIDEALSGVPGVLAQSRYGTSDVRIVIRGFGARGAGDRSNAGTTRGIRILQDGFPETEPDGRTALDLVDLAATQRVEVVRSNASALWGNAAGGIVNFSSTPYFERPFAEAEQDVGGFGLRREIVQVGTRTGGARLSVTAVRTDLHGWRENSGATRSLVNLGAVAPLAPRSRLRVQAIAADNSFDIPGPLTFPAMQSDPSRANSTYLQRHERRRNRLGRVGVALDHELTAGRAVSASLFVTPKYLQRSERGTFRDFTRYHVGGAVSVNQVSTLSPAVRSTLTAGLDEAYQDGAILFYSLTPTGGRGTELRDNKREGANNFGTFVQERLSFGRRLDVTIGARYDDIAYYNNSFIDPRLDASKSFARLTPKLGLVFRASDDRSFYANVGGGVEAPAGNETDPASTFGQDTITGLNPLLEPIHSTTWEAGSKQIRTFADGAFLRAFSYDVAVYWTAVTNEIVPYRGGRFYFTAGKVRRRGAEAGVQVQTAHGVSLDAALTFSDHRYRDYMVDSVHYGRPGHYADYAGNRVVGVPDFFASGSLRWTPPTLEPLQLGLGWQNVQRYFADDANRVAVPAYTLLDATVSLSRPVQLAGGWRARGFLRVENLADRRYVASAYLNPDVVDGLPVAFEPGLPRHVVLALSLGRGR